MLSPANVNAALPPHAPIRAADRATAHAQEAAGAPSPVAKTGMTKVESARTTVESPAHTPVLWPAQIDPVAVHTAVLIAQEAYRNQKALEGLAMLVQVSSAAKAEVPRPAMRPSVRPPSPADPQGNGGFSR